MNEFTLLIPFLSHVEFTSKHVQLCIRVARDSWNEICFDLLKPFMVKQAVNTCVFGGNYFLNACGLPRMAY